MESQMNFSPLPEPAPWSDFDDLNVGEVISRVRNGPDDAAMRARILAYERAHKNRKGVIVPLVNWNS
jgi:hypothetical protein